MTDAFFAKPILNSPYRPPTLHWELDAEGQPTQRILESRRQAAFISPVPKPRKQQGTPEQILLTSPEGHELADATGQQYDQTAVINSVRQQVDQWRRIPNPDAWHVTPET